MMASELAGRTVVVTRASHQAASLATALRERGATVVVAPAIAVVPPLDGGQPLDDALLRLEQYSWVAFTSANAVAATFARADRRGVRRGFARIRTAALGPATAARVEAEINRPVNLLPDEHDAVGLAAAFPEPRADDWCFVPQSAQARPELADGLRSRGWNVDAVSAYRTVTPTLSDHLVADVAAADVVVFASPSAVRGHLSQIAGDAAPVDADLPELGGSPSTPHGSHSITAKVVCIGNTTSAACAEAELPVAAVAASPTDTGLVEAVAAALRADDHPASL
jgi:uroporphyrinogen-III synthase